MTRTYSMIHVWENGSFVRLPVIKWIWPPPGPVAEANIIRVLLEYPLGCQPARFELISLGGGWNPFHWGFLPDDRDPPDGPTLRAWWADQKARWEYRTITPGSTTHPTMPV